MNNDRAARIVVAKSVVTIMPLLFGIAVVVPLVRGRLTASEFLFGVGTFLAFGTLAVVIGVPIARARLARESSERAGS